MSGGYRVRVTAWHVEAGREGRRFVLDDFRAETGVRALARLRIKVRRVAWYLELAESREASFAWLGDRRSREYVLTCLARGSAYFHGVGEGETSYAFSVEPEGGPDLGPEGGMGGESEGVPDSGPGAEPSPE